jgi:hypothetical protein
VDVLGVWLSSVLVDCERGADRVRLHDTCSPAGYSGRALAQLVLLLTDEVAGSAAMNGRRGSEDEEVAADGFEGLGLPPEDPDADLGKLALGAESICTAAAEAGTAAFAVL